MMWNPYFKIVETEEEMEIFKRIWLEVCNEMTFETEDFHTKKTGMHILIKNHNGDYVGTAEIGKYQNNEKSTVQYYYDYSKMEQIVKEMNNTYEVDKICIYPEYRSSGLLLNVVYAMLFHKYTSQSVYYVAAMEWKFYKSLKRFYKIPVKEVGQKQQFNDFYLQPIIVYIDEYIKQLQTNNNLDIDFEFLDKLANSYMEGQNHETITSK